MHPRHIRSAHLYKLQCHFIHNKRTFYSILLLPAPEIFEWKAIFLSLHVFSCCLQQNEENACIQESRCRWHFVRLFEWHASACTIALAHFLHFTLPVGNGLDAIFMCKTPRIFITLPKHRTPYVWWQRSHFTAHTHTYLVCIIFGWNILISWEFIQKWYQTLVQHYCV